MTFNLSHEQRMTLIRSIWSNLGEHEQYLTDDRFIKDKIEEQIQKLKELETILWAGDNK
jgi:hypothetical protein